MCSPSDPRSTTTESASRRHCELEVDRNVHRRERVYAQIFLGPVTNAAHEAPTLWITSVLLRQIFKSSALFPQYSNSDLLAKRLELVAALGATPRPPQTKRRADQNRPSLSPSLFRLVFIPHHARGRALQRSTSADRQSCPAMFRLHEKSFDPTRRSADGQELAYVLSWQNNAHT